VFVEIIDQVRGGVAVVDHRDVADTIRPWYPEAPADVAKAIDDLQVAINRGDPAQHGLAEFLAVSVTIAPAWLYATVVVPSSSLAVWLVDTVSLKIGDGATSIGFTVLLSWSAVTALGDLPADHDGHFDGQHVWIGGSEYAVSCVTRTSVA
jgi:hypothetical protein